MISLNRCMTFGGLFLCMCAIMVMLFLQGCSPAVMAVAGAGTAAAAYGVYRVVGATPVVESILKAAGKEAAIYGLQKLSPETGRVVAKDTLLATSDALKYLKGDAKGATADVINQAITGAFANVNPVLLQEIQNVAAILGDYVPNASVVLNATELADLIAFVQGIQDGANTYLGNPLVTIKYKYVGRSSGRMKVDGAYPPWFVPVVVEKQAGAPCSDCK